MTVPITVKKKCFMCQQESTQVELMSTNAFGSADLDLRPPEMQRSTMTWWVQECPHCGYVSSNIENFTLVPIAWLKSKEYVECNSELNMKSPLAVRFYKHYLFCKKGGLSEKAFGAIVNCAWACDDRSDEENAVYCRKLALLESDEIIKRGGGNETLLVRRADFLRRSKQFDEVIKRYEGMTFSEEILNQIIAFQIEKAKQRDVGCYTVKMAIDSAK